MFGTYISPGLFEDVGDLGLDAYEGYERLLNMAAAAEKAAAANKAAAAAAANKAAAAAAAREATAYKVAFEKAGKPTRWLTRWQAAETRRVAAAIEEAAAVTRLDSNETVSGCWRMLGQIGQLERVATAEGELAEKATSKKAAADGESAGRPSAEKATARRAAAKGKSAEKATAEEATAKRAAAEGDSAVRATAEKAGSRGGSRGTKKGVKKGKKF
jgi:hypothetical protein